MSLSTGELWSAALSLLKAKLSQQQYETWFRELNCTYVSLDREVVIEAPSRFCKSWLSNHYLDLINECLSEAAGHRMSAAIRARDEFAASGSMRGSLPAPSRKKPSAERGVPLNKNFTFDTFVVAPSNALAHAAAIAISDAPGRLYNPLFVHSSVGMGKTHLLQACCHGIKKKNPHLNILYLSCESFVNEFIASVEKGELENFRYNYRHVDVLAIDDIHFLASKERSQEEFFHTFNTLYHSQKQIILSSDSPPKDIRPLEDRLVTRFKWGLVAKIDPPEMETRISIIQMKAKLLNRNIPREVTEYLAANVTTSIRELEGAIIRVLGISALTNRPLDMKIAREALRERRATGAKVNIVDILSTVAARFSLKVTDLQGKKRPHHIAFPRQICMFLAKELTHLSLTEIGGHFGSRDHTTVLYAVKKIKERIKADPSLEETIAKLREDLTVGRHY